MLDQKVIKMLIAVKNLSPCPKKLSIVIKCPKCGEEGLLRVYRRNMFGRRTYVICHGNKRCKISFMDDSWEEIDKLYHSIRC